MTYLTLAIPNDPAILEAAKRISQASDPDVGGYHAFQLACVDAQGHQYMAYGSPVDDAFAASSVVWKTAPDQLQTFVAQDMATRFPGDPVPTLADVTAFCAAVLMSQQYGVLAALEELGLTIVAQ